CPQSVRASVLGSVRSQAALGALIQCLVNGIQQGLVFEWLFQEIDRTGFESLFPGIFRICLFL
ncbi:MAG: hypothetical protein V3U27_13315, partial [Candidatus Tectomicrobia bacterium]